MNCHENGTTRLLLTRIPFFREIVIMSFECPECHFRNAEIQSAGEIQQRGVKYTFRADSTDDLQRQIVKSDTCVVRVEEMDLEIPAGRGQLTNLEGLLAMVREDLQTQQPQRKEVAHELYEQIEHVSTLLSQMVEGNKFPFTITIDDPAGNSSLEPSPADKGGKYSRSEYPRTTAHNAALGLGDEEASDAQQAPATEIRPEYRAAHMYPSMPEGADTLLNVDTLDSDDIVENEVYSFPSTCPGCNKSCATNMKMVKIPHFKEVVLMSTACEHCGYRSNEVKSGGEVPEKGRKIVLKVLNGLDLSRDILKAESCSLACPELNLTVEPGTLGGRFTTVEGLLTQVRDDLRSSIFDTGDQGVEGGDSMAAQKKSKWSEFFEGLDKAIKGEIEFTVVLEDPLASSYIQSLTAPEPDAQITMEEYERTEEEEENLGLRDINTENYAEDA